MWRLLQFFVNRHEHTALPNSHRTFNAWNVFVCCWQGSFCRKACAHTTDVTLKGQVKAAEILKPYILKR